MEHWRSRIDISHPVWGDYRDRLLSLEEKSFPGPMELSLLLPTGLHSKGGRPIRFVPARDLPGVDYEKHIFCEGEVSTREDNWHDLFNALVWSRFPRLKIAMNAMHFRELGAGGEGGRGKIRDALTLFDESGVIVCSNSRERLDVLALREWNTVFQAGAGTWQDEIRVFLVGHALLEKFLRPYKSLTAHALLLHLDEPLLAQPRDALLPALDKWVAKHLPGGYLLDSPSCLSPLPLMGIPGWWPGGVQDDEFYSDQDVFRPMRDGGRKAPVLDLGHGSNFTNPAQS
jgi:hypothetical protein